MPHGPPLKVLWTSGVVPPEEKFRPSGRVVVILRLDSTGHYGPKGPNNQPYFRPLQLPYPQSTSNVPLVNYLVVSLSVFTYCYLVIQSSSSTVSPVFSFRFSSVIIHSLLSLLPTLNVSVLNQS